MLFRINRSRGAVRDDKKMSFCPSASQSQTASALPSCGRSSSVTEPTSAIVESPRFRKQQFRSLPLQPLPSRINLFTATQPLRYDAWGVGVLVEGDCDATRRQKKLHKSTSFAPVTNPFATTKSSRPSLLRSTKLELHDQRPMATPESTLTSRIVPSSVFLNNVFP